MVGDFPDFLHRFVFDGMQRVGVAPLLEGLAFGGRTVRGMQTHAPLRGGIGDGVVFGFCKVLFAHWLFLVSRILPFAARLVEPPSWLMPIKSGTYFWPEASATLGFRQQYPQLE